MDLITVRDLFKNTEKYAGVEVNVGGWVRNRRGSKQFGFIVLNDGTYFTPVQVVYNDTLENFQEISKINIGAALIIRGTLVLTPDSKQPFEIQAESITVEGPSTGDYPLQPKRHSMDQPSTPPHQHLPGGVPRPQSRRYGHSPVLPGSGLCVCPHTPDHRLRLRGRGRNVPGHHP